jgi:hypothetical protein
MANGIFVPPWLKGIEPGELAATHARGLELGQRAAAQQANTLLTMQEMQNKQAEAAMRQQMAQQDIDLQIKKQEAQAQQAAQELALKQEGEKRMAATSAMRYAGQRQYQNTYDKLLTEGKTPDEARLEAVKQSAPLMLAQAPGEAIRAMTGLLPKAPPKEMTTSTGQRYFMGPSGVPQFFPQPRDQATERLPQTESMELQDLYKSKRELQKDLTEEQSNLAALEPAKSEKSVVQAYASTKAKVELLQKQLNENEARIKSFSKTPGMTSPGQPGGTGIRIRSKETGRVFRYKGSREDVPADEYDILE